MIDVVRDDGASARNLVTDELRRDRRRDARAEALAGVLAAQALGHFRERLLPQLVFTDRDELHFRRDDAATRVVHLRHVGAGVGAPRRPMQIESEAGKRGIGEARAPVRRRRRIEHHRIGAFVDPRGPQRRQAAADVDVRVRIRVGTRRVVDGERRVVFGAERCRRIALRDFTHRHADVRACTCDVDLAGRGKRCDRGGIDFRVAREKLVVGVHSCSSWPGNRRSGGRPTLPCAGIIRTGSKGVLSPTCGPRRKDP